MELSGFENLDPSTKIIIRKLIGNQVKKINDTTGDFDKLILNLNESDRSHYSLSGTMEISGKVHSAEVDDSNLFFGLSRILDDLKCQMG